MQPVPKPDKARGAVVKAYVVLRSILHSCDANLIKIAAEPNLMLN
jgi:hypothetical protein